MDRTFRHSVCVAVLAGALVWPANLSAQEDVTGQVWVDFLTDWYVTSHHLLELEVGPKVLFSGGQRWAELKVTPAYELVAGPRFELVVRTLFSWVRQNSALSTFEIRPVLGFRLYILKPSEHRFMVRDFNRVESRNIRYVQPHRATSPQVLPALVTTPNGRCKASPQLGSF